VAIIGCGKISDQHVLAVRRIPDTEIVGVCDREALMAEQLAERHTIAYFSDDLSHLLDTTHPHVVHVTTPPQSHYRIATQCLQAGCHVYVEKPFTVDSGDAVRLVRLAQEQNLKLTVGHNLLYTWEALEAQHLVQTGFLGGAPLHVESYYTYHLGDAAYASALLADRNHWVRTLPGQLLHNVISHPVAPIAAYLQTDSPTVHAYGSTSPLLKRLGESDLVDEVRVQIHDGGTTTACLVFSTQLSPPMNGFRLYGPRQSLVVDHHHRTLIRLRENSYKSYLNYLVPPLIAASDHVRAARRNVSRFIRRSFHDDAGLKNLVEAFYRCINGEGALPISYREILLSSRIMDEIFVQLNSARPASVGEEVAIH